MIEEEKNVDIKNLNSSWDNAISIHARALFDTRQKYIILPIKFFEFFEKFWDLVECEEVFDETLDLKYFSCNNKTYEEIKNDKPIYFIIDGYGFKFNFNELFQNDGNIKNSIIRFTNTISNSNIFIFGIPFFKKYDIMFDYENKRVGFKGDDIIDFTRLYNNWKEEETVIKINESNAISILWTNEKVMMIIGAIFGGIIIIYVLFFVIRSMKREDSNKIHSNFVEQVRDY